MVVGDITTATDLLVIGGGPAGIHGALRAAELGWDVTLVTDGALGGTETAAALPVRLLAKASLAARGGGGEDPADFPAVLARALREVDRVRQELARRLTAAGVHVVAGRAELTGPDTAVVDGAEGAQPYHFKHALLATGARPRRDSGLLADGRRTLLPEDLLHLPELPARVVVVGGGLTGVEVGLALLRLGAAVTVVEAEERLLPLVAEEVAAEAWRQLNALGARVCLGVRAVAVEVNEQGVSVQCLGPGGPEVMVGSHCLLATGREPCTAALGLERLGLHDPLCADRRGRTAAPHLHAAGDALGPPMAAPRAALMGRVAAEDMAGRPAEFRPAAVPMVLCADPELAWVGLSAAEGAALGADVEVRRVAVGPPQGEGWAQLVLDKGTGVLLGAAMAGAGAGEAIAEMALALELAATREDIAQSLHPGLTTAATWQEAALAEPGAGV